MSEIYKEIMWECPKCKHKNSDTYLAIETHPVKCTNCKNEFDVYVQAKLDVKVLNVSDGTCSEEEVEELIIKNIQQELNTFITEKYNYIEILEEKARKQIKNKKYIKAYRLLGKAKKLKKQFPRL